MGLADRQVIEDTIYVERESLQKRGIDAEDLLVPVEVLDARQIGELMDQQDVVLSF